MRLPLAVLLFILGCGLNDPVYVAVQGIEAGNMGGAARASSVVDMQYRAPTQEEVQERAQLTQQRGYEAPFLHASDVAVEVLYAVTNLANREGTARIDVSGGNEFVRYDPEAIVAAQIAAGVDDDEVVALPLVQGTPFTVAPGQTVQGRIREDDMAEAALDLDAIGRWMATPAAVLINRSEVNPAGLDQVPANLIVPGFARVQVTLDANRHMRATVSVRVRDKRERLTGSAPFFMPTPTDVMIMVAP